MKPDRVLQALGVSMLTLIVVAVITKAVVGDTRSGASHPFAVTCRDLGGVVKLDSSMRFGGCLLPPSDKALVAEKVGP